MHNGVLAVGLLIVAQDLLESEVIVLTTLAKTSSTSTSSRGCLTKQFERPRNFHAIQKDESK